MNKWFDLVVDELKINNYHWYNLILSHEPLKELPEGYINIHWHLHSNTHHIQYYSLTPEKYILYSQEKEKFMPITLETLLKRNFKN